MKKTKFSLNTIFAGMSSLCVMAAALPFSTIQSSIAVENGVYGDANLDGTLSISDAVMIMSYASNPTTTNLPNPDLCDVYNRGDGIDAMDSLSVQKRLTNILTSLPESYADDQKTDASYIHLKNTSISTEGDNVEVNGTTVTITASGEYYVDGTLDDGQIIVNVPDESADAETVKIFLNGVNITGSSAPAIYVNNAANTSLNLVEGTTNVISDGSVAYEDDYLDNAVIHAKDDMTIKGAGTLKITAHTQNAVHCNNDLKINGGNIDIVTETGDALRGKTSLTIKDGSLTIDSKGDGIKSTKGNVSITGGDMEIKAGNDAVQAETTMDISGGNIIASGDRGLTAATAVNITGGTVIATATDNQAELVTATQGTMLLNCIDDASNTDGCWKKSNAVAISDSITASPLKKFKYILISDASIKSGSSYSLTNTAASAVVTHSNGSSFDMTSDVTTFESVNLASAATSEDPVTDVYTVTLDGSSIITNAPADTAISANGIVNITKPGVFQISGKGSEVQILVDVDKTTYPEGVVELDLMGTDITNTSNSPIYVAQIGDECQIVAKKGYTNTISDGTNYTNPDGKMGAIYSCDDLKIKGSGSLTVNGNGEDAIVSKNDIKIYNGNITVNSVDDGIRGKDSVTIGNAADTDFTSLSVTVKSTSGDGIKSTETDTASGKGFITINGGTMNITAYSDGFHASQLLNVNGGSIDITTTCPATTSSGGNNQGGWGGPGGGMGGFGESSSTSTEVSAKGLKAGCTDDTTNTVIEGTINISGGSINIDSTDDSIHATDINISGGDITASSGDDGVHADDILTVQGGSINIIKSYEGLEAADIEIMGGNIHVVASDDGFNAAGGADNSGNNNPGGWGPGGGFSSSTGTLNICGGYIFVRAEGDGLDSNGDLSISDGTVIVCGPTGGGNGIFDKGDGNYTLSFTGGTVFGIGTSDMMETPTASNGTYLMANSGVNASAGTLISAADSSGNVVAVLKVPAELNSIQAIQFYSADADSSTGLYSGGTYSGELNADGYGEGGTITGASSISTSSGGETGGWGSGGNGRSSGFSSDGFNSSFGGRSNGFGGR